MTERKSWEEFFDKHASQYDQNIFTKNTLKEVDFLLEELMLEPKSRILDIGCGTGRHSIELAKRGYKVTGLDLSSGMLSKAKEAADSANVQVEWVQADATRFSFPEKFDAAICLCEGSFGLLGNDDDPIDQPLSILRNIADSLKSGGKAVFKVLNAMAMIRRYQNDDVSAGRFDPITLVESSEMAPSDDHPPIKVRERAFVPTELMLLFAISGLTILNIWGGTAGNWRRGTIDLDEIEIMVVAQKKI